MVVRAKMLSIVENFPQTDDLDGGWVDFKLKAEHALIGRTDGTFVARMKVSAFPIQGSQLYVIGVESTDGTVLVDQWGWASEGLCVDRELAKSRGIEAAVFQLRRELAVKTAPNCETQWEE